ncbi:MAG: hypothetical protein ACQEXX_00085 [Bacillota bacterium]
MNVTKEEGVSKKRIGISTSSLYTLVKKTYTIGNTDIIITSSGVTKVDTKEEDETLGWKGKVITMLLTEKEGLLESEDVIQRGYKPVNPRDPNEGLLSL